MIEIQTPIQRLIERTVTNGRGYNRNAKIDFSLRDTEFGLQMSLSNMDFRDGKLDMYSALDCITRIEAMQKKFKEARIPLEVITTADGFSAAFHSVYSFQNTQYIISDLLDQNPYLGIPKRFLKITPDRESFKKPSSDFSKYLDSDPNLSGSMI